MWKKLFNTNLTGQCAFFSFLTKGKQHSLQNTTCQPVSYYFILCTELRCESYFYQMGFDWQLRLQEEKFGGHAFTGENYNSFNIQSAKPLLAADSLNILSS